MFYYMEQVAEKSKSIIKVREAKAFMMSHLKESSRMLEEDIVKHLRTMKAEYETFMTITPCDECHGQRLKQESLAVTVADKNIAEMCDMSLVKW